MWFSICRRYTPARSLESMRVLVVEDEPYMAEAIRDGLRLEAIAADIAGDGDTALERLSVNAYDIAVLDRDVPGPSGDEIAEACPSSCSPLPTGSTTRPLGSNSAPTTTSPSPSNSENSCSASEHSTAGAPTTDHPCERSQACVWIRSAARSTATAATSRSPGNSSHCSKSSSLPKAGSSAQKSYWNGRGMRTPTRSPTPCASRSRHCANASANPGSSPPSPASATASTQRPAPDE